ncbi:MAG: MOSC domain-containing protein [Anaerolineales bacterium]|nr:MOSC domain-containing protein [Anaerolineales bacterium]
MTESFVERMGLANDRRMMVVTPDGEFLTQREYPKLALITPTLTNDIATLAAPNFDSLRVAIRNSGANFPVNIWGSENVSAVDLGDDAARWLSDWLGVSVRLVHFADGYKRRLNPDYAINADDHTGFADGYPILIISEESLNDLNSKMESPLPMNRFRPNIVIKGCAPFEEDSWKRIKIGEVEMALVKPCPRCVVTTIDKETLEKNKEPLKTLAKYRNHELGAIFGMNTIPLNEGKIHIGMEVEIIQ